MLSPFYCDLRDGMGWLMALVESTHLCMQCTFLMMVGKKKQTTIGRHHKLIRIKNIQKHTEMLVRKYLCETSLQKLPEFYLDFCELKRSGGDP